MVVAVNPFSAKSAAAASSTALRVSSLYSALRPLTVMPTRLQLPTMSQFSTDGQTLETSRGPVRLWRTGAGSGPAVLFLQGFLAGPDVWSPVVAELAGRHRCITADWPFGAHRLPMRADADLSPPGVAELVVEVLDLLGERDAVLVGNDSGGVIAQL